LTDPARVTLLTGGARSGKSAAALALAEAFPAVRRLFVATAEARDADMAERIARHRRERGPAWTTLESPHDWAGPAAAAEAGDCVVVDCLTLWTANRMGEGSAAEEADFAAEIDRAAAMLRRSTARVIIVTNEVGLGIVPDNAAARAFRDRLGRANAATAAVADRVAMLVAGIPWVLKGPAWPGVDGGAR
jgi:adenosylcobinamide kinase/adenosylcobinamide-phosphate guanylyltransferase